MFGTGEAVVVVVRSPADHLVGNPVHQWIVQRDPGVSKDQ